MDYYLPLLIIVVVGVVVVLLAAKYPKWFGIRTSAEERAEQDRRFEEQARRARVSQQILEAKLAPMSEEERERFLDREFRFKALWQGVVWGIFAWGAFYIASPWRLPREHRLRRDWGRLP